MALDMASLQRWASSGYSLVLEPNMDYDLFPCSRPQQTAMGWSPIRWDHLPSCSILQVWSRNLGFEAFAGPSVNLGIIKHLDYNHYVPGLLWDQYVPGLCAGNTKQRDCHAAGSLFTGIALYRVYYVQQVPDLHNATASC